MREDVEHAVTCAMDALLQVGGINPDRCYLDVNGYRLHHLALGHGRPVLLIHGAGGGGANWYRVMGPLARDFRVLAPDLPGFGLSAAMPVRSDLGTQAAEVLAAWAERVVSTDADIVATSFGGLAALRLAQREPGRIRRLVLLDTVGLGRHLPIAVRMAGLPLLNVWLQRPTLAGTRWLFRTMLVDDADALGKEDRDALVSYLYASATASRRTLEVAMRRFAGVRGQREVLTDDELRAWRHPTMALWGARDRFLPRTHGLRAARLIPSSSFYEIPGAGHSPNWERPDEVVEKIRTFLGSP